MAPRHRQAYTQTYIMLMSLPLSLLFQNPGGISYRRIVTSPDNISLVTSPPPSLPHPLSLMQKTFQLQTDKAPLCQGLWHLCILGTRSRTLSLHLSLEWKWEARNWLQGCAADCSISHSQFVFKFKFARAVILITACIMNNLWRSGCFSQGLLILFSSSDNCKWQI